MEVITLPSAISTTAVAISLITTSVQRDSEVTTTRLLGSAIKTSVNMPSPIDLEDTGT